MRGVERSFDLPQNHIPPCSHDAPPSGQRDVLGDARSLYLLEFDVYDVPDLAKAALEVLLARVFGQAANVNFVRLRAQRNGSIPGRRRWASSA